MKKIIRLCLVLVLLIGLGTGCKKKSDSKKITIMTSSFPSYDIVRAITKDSDNIVCKDLYHPLVKNCIPNDLSFENGIILTGSNMSGKTTFMRTLGVAQILKNAGALIPATYYSAPKLKLLTSTFSSITPPVAL